jgi:battenin
MPFKAIRDAYPTYQTLYQLGVFLSRSSSTFYRIHNIYLPSIIQFSILCFLILQALFVIIPSIYPLFIIIFFEGILGGLVYVNAFHEVHERELVDKDREFALGAGTFRNAEIWILTGFSGDGGFGGRYGCWVFKSGIRTNVV